MDDTAGAAAAQVADQHYVGVIQTFTDLGLQFDLGKYQAPSMQMMWIGVWFDAVRMLMSIDRERIHEAVELCKEFIMATNVTLFRLQSLIGKSFHVSKCTSGVRAFISRLLDLLRRAMGATNGTSQLGGKGSGILVHLLPFCFYGVTSRPCGGGRLVLRECGENITSSGVLLHQVPQVPH